MTRLIRSSEAAAILGVAPATLYAYVSRGRLGRTVGPDGRTSLFARDEVEQLARRTRRGVTRAHATIDVQVTSNVTTIDETSLRYRGRDVAELVAGTSFEDVAELLWSDVGGPLDAPTTWPDLDEDDRAALAGMDQIDLPPLGKLGLAAHLLAELHPTDAGSDGARRLLLAAPRVLGSRRQRGPYARRLVDGWRRRPPAELVDAVDAALVLLADHELATTTLAVRVAASLRTTPYHAFAAGLACTAGTINSAAAGAHELIATCADRGVRVVIEERRSNRRVLPGFGHTVYRRIDPRFEPLLEHVRRLDGTVAGVVDAIVAETGRVLPQPPNIDLAVGALTLAGGLDPGCPMFAVARIAGWGAHFDEEVTERPIRFRGAATSAR